MNPITVISTTPASRQWKLVVLDIVTVLTAGLFGYTFARYLAGGFSPWLVFGALLVWSAMSVLEGFLEKSIARRFLVILLESLALIAFFYTYDWQALAITVILVLACLMWGFFSIRRELRSTIEIRFFTASGKMVGKVITAAVIFMVVMYASLTNNNGSFFVSPSGFNEFFNWSAGFVNNFYPTVPLTGSFGDFAQAIARMQLQGNPAFQSLTPAEQSSTVTQSAGQIIGAISNSSSTSVASSTANEPTSNAFYNYLAALSVSLQEKFGNAFVGVWALLLFFILRSIGIIAVWIGEFVALIFYEILLATGFMKITEQPATKEIVEY